MRKIFTTLKSVVAFALVVAMTLSVSCSYDDTAIKNDISKVKTDLAKLEERVAALESKLTDELVAAIDLVKNAVVVTGVVTDENGNTTVTLSDGKSFVIEKTSDNDTILAAYAEDGVYYWAFFEGETFVKFLEVEGQKVPVFAEDDCAPAELVFSVDEATGNLLVSIDGGATWVDSGISTNKVAGACVFTEVVVNEDGSVTFYFADGTSFEVAKAELVEFEATRSQVYVKAGETKAIPFAINDAVEDINVMNQPLGWKASVESTRAVGGMDFVLNITAPSKEFLAAGFAEKEGQIAIHFNTAAGACKVMNVAVNLAELSIAVDKAGNITIKNSVLDFYEGYDNLTWEPYEYENFVTWYIGVLPIQSFNGTITEDVMSDSVLGTYGWMFGVDEKRYVEGEYELQVVETSLQWMFEEINYEEMSTTESYVVYLVPFADGGKTPVFEDAVYTSFKQLNVVVEEVEAYYNDVLLNVTFAGAEKYHVAAVAESDLEWYDGSVENYIQENIMMYFAYGSVQFANTIEEDFFGKEISLRGLIDYGTEPWYNVLPNETYYLIVLPIEDSSVAYTDYVLEDFLYYSFESLDIVEATTPIEHTATFVDEESSALGISVQVSYNTEVVDYAYYKWYTEEQLDLTKEELLMGNKVNFDSLAYESCDAPGEQKVLAVLLVNKNGEYTIAQHTFHSKDIVYSDAAISFESVTFEDGEIYVTIAGAENVEYFRYYVNAVDVANTSEEFLAPLAYKTISGGKTAYTNPFSQAYTSNWSRYAEGNTYFIALVAVFKDGTVTKPITGEFTYEAAVVEPVDPFATAALVTDTTFNGFNPYDVTFGFENGDQVAVRFNTSGAQYLHLGAWQTDNWQDPHYISQVKYNGELATITACNVAYENDVYTVTMSVFEYTNYNTFEYTYTGAIEGLIAPEACDCIQEPEGGEAVDRVDIEFTLYTGEGKTVVFDPGTGYCAMDLIDAEGKNYIRFEFNESGAYPVSGKTYTFSPADTSYNFGTLSGNGVYVGLDGWVQAGLADYGGVVPSSGTITVSSVEGDVYTFVLDFVLPDGSKFAGTYVGALPF